MTPIEKNRIVSPFQMDKACKKDYTSTPNISPTRDSLSIYMSMKKHKNVIAPTQGSLWPIIKKYQKI